MPMNTDYREYFRIKNEKAAAQIGPKLSGSATYRLRTDERWEPYVSKVLNSGIDFSKRGWVGKVSQLLNLSPGKCGAWMKRYMPAFYENNCVKRKAPICQTKK